ncbi:hypothetical protein CAPN004_09000 [Capnocytophaga cynodegmi]|uniref:hypothetical protein n=1 Tax=Capnocytophaga cynodegmi TaxID=28189 RepID=UPI001AC51471|nr:hypothetical protein [Capnocytophaga cynodegmi]GIM51870.1 hypothetical protein CAPN004_09000 [Capnocytophaga cynodegmi]
MKEIDKLCNEVLLKTQEKGGRINAATYEQIVGRDDYTFRQVKMKLLALGLIEKRDDNKIFLTEKGLNAKNIKQANRKPINKGTLFTIIGVIVALLSFLWVILTHYGVL